MPPQVTLQQLPPSDCWLYR